MQSRLYYFLTSYEIFLGGFQFTSKSISGSPSVSLALTRIQNSMTASALTQLMTLRDQVNDRSQQEAQLAPLLEGDGQEQ